MANRNAYPTGADPGTDPTLAGTEKLALRKVPSDTSRAIPEVRKKNKHLDEIYKLKQEMSALQDENGDLHVSMRRMALDIGKAEKQLEEKTQEQKGNGNGATLLQQKIDQLSAALNVERNLRAEAERKLPGVDTERQKDEERYLRLRSEISRLTSALLDKEAQLLDKDQKLVEAQSMLSGTTNNAQEHISRLTVQLQQETRNLEVANHNLMALQQQTAVATTGELEELRQRCAFYQKNSESLSKRLMNRNTGD